MPITVTITDESGTGRVAAAMTLDGIAERITVRDLVSDIRFIRLAQLARG